MRGLLQTAAEQLMSDGLQYSGGIHTAAEVTQQRKSNPNLQVHQT